VVTEGASQEEVQVVAAQAVDPQAAREEVPVVTLAPLERSQSTLAVAL
jgi:hypothetical protein